MINAAMVYRQFGKPEEVLQPETGLKAKRPEHFLRVKMLLAPVNASDLIPITGAYRHRVSSGETDALLSSRLVQFDRISLF